MKKLWVLTCFSFLAACSTSEDALDLSLKSSHTVHPSLNYMGANGVENWLMGKWRISSEEGGADRFGKPYTEFSDSSIKGKWMISTAIGTNKNGEYTIIEEGSFKVEEDYWGSGAHYIQGSVFRTAIAGNYLYEEVEKISEDELRVYLRGFDVSSPPAGFDPENPDPKLAVRPFKGLLYNDYIRVK